MAVIDLKDASILIVDGTTGAASTTVATAATKGAETVVLTSATGFGVGSSIKFGTHPQIYSITDIATNTITVEPPLVADVASTATAVEGPNAVEVTIGEGNLTYSEKRNVEYVKNRGKLDTVKLGDEEPVEVSLDFTWEFLRATSGECPTVEEAIKQIGEAASWTSTSSDACEPYAVDIFIIYVPPCASDQEVVELRDFRWESMDHSLKDGSVSVKGNCNVTQAVVTHYSS